MLITWLHDSHTHPELVVSVVGQRVGREDVARGVARNHGLNGARLHLFQASNRKCEAHRSFVDTSTQSALAPTQRRRVSRWLPWMIRPPLTRFFEVEQTIQRN